MGRKKADLVRIIVDEQATFRRLEKEIEELTTQLGAAKLLKVSDLQKQIKELNEELDSYRANEKETLEKVEGLSALVTHESYCHAFNDPLMARLGACSCRAARLLDIGPAGG
jgi:hypothetical protein